ncbi:MAG: helix-turn-helix transcriptional regulator [Sulfurimonas sp.]|jgi:DNA-binding NarL/FixJ family response regulator
MEIIFFSANMEIIKEWREKHDIEHSITCYDSASLKSALTELPDYILIADYDSVASDINKMITSNSVPNNMIILEKAPEIATGKMLIAHNVKAYGNARMLTIHFMQMLQTVLDDKIWTYPELTAALSKISKDEPLKEESESLLNNRLTAKEIEVIKLILGGYTNDAIASALDITTRTVKAHVSSIFSKLHVNDRVSLVLLLK